MKAVLLGLMLLCAVPTFACDKDYKKEYFEQDGHLYFTVTGYCRGKIQYTMHRQECPCGDGEYEVKQ